MLPKATGELTAANGDFTKLSAGRKLVIGESAKGLLDGEEKTYQAQLAAGDRDGQSDDADAPLVQEAWSWANKPPLDINDALGRTGQTGGFEKGVIDLLSGVTSPLSLALTIGTLGAGGLAEAGGASALREAALAGDAINDVTQGARIVQAHRRQVAPSEKGWRLRRAQALTQQT